MKKVFVKTKNVKKFVALMSELQELPPNIPKMALVFGDYGLGKSETIQWWCFKNNCVYVRANQGMTRKWLLSEIAIELGEKPNWNSQENFELIERKLQQAIKNNSLIVIYPFSHTYDMDSLTDDQIYSLYFDRFFPNSLK